MSGVGAPRLVASHWPAGAYPRADLPERVLQFGTGMLLRALSAAAVDASVRQGRAAGRIVVVQSTPQGAASAVNAQGGLFTLVERGLENGAPVDRSRLIGSISRALVADTQWDAVRAVVARPELQVIVSNVTEAGFTRAGVFPARLTDLLRARFAALPDGPPLFVIPTELVPENGLRVAEMVDEVAASSHRAFRDWLSQRVRFCSSLVDRITTAPSPDVRAELEARLGYADSLLTLTEPHALWAIAADPAELSGVFPIDRVEGVVFAPDISFYSQRKLRILNGAHTAMAPLAILSSVATVRDATQHPILGAFLEHMLFDEIVPGCALPVDAAREFAQTVLDRFRNPWLAHRWDVIATNQTPKLRVRVLPSALEFARSCHRVPQRLALACAASLRYARCTEQLSTSEGRGWWRGASYPIQDVDLQRLNGHWWAVDPEHAAGPVPAETLQRLAARIMGDAGFWGVSFAEAPEFVAAVAAALCRLEEVGPPGAIAALERA
ncbi:MAG TPA: tagaturonate reductase [Gemmatimonadales bacterium]|nr:tagaturonate reductase [Gemmatimonadales bacterium]